MRCPFCGSDHTRVKDTRRCLGELVRKRVCEACGERFSTAERITAEYLQVRKRDGRVQPFSRAKIRDGILKAAVGSDLSVADVSAFVDGVVQLLNPDAPDLPVSSRDIGRLVLEQLRCSSTITDVTCIRFAMVFTGDTTPGLGFRRTADFITWLEDAYGPPRAARPAATPSAVVKNSGHVEPFVAEKLSRSVELAAARCATADRRRSLALHVSAAVIRELTGQALVTSQQIAAETLKELRSLDQLTYLRYGSVVKRYRSVDDFWLDLLGCAEPADQVASRP
jgi:transcriptional repressor NrdR